MTIESASMTIVTENLPETRRFYETHFSARPVFDCGWYVVLRMTAPHQEPEICLMSPQDGMQPFSGGVFLNILVDNADQLHSRLTEAGLQTTIPLESHPWGDRGFGLLDPSGVIVYCYHPIEPSSEFDQYIIERT
ncbi:glyoxalase/bleomycin resistance protein/dioxygenase superfamily protein [Tamilnaduibacter salinus]|uniref:Glyoxalase/bleomycin resistance protein/dioxygenase superfamily protein n=1 Tax=Tamilnaduibacter salinus TaxID=1484056 RepID=A0A2U1CTW9_9GAMM|nr:VOC family protein [Tamilnaduibacter salinus]PVY70108.1 glyoxalase/bleomycin resistance protein/dioxygenase superfamily protein [Tamilnaduibacter salinus]